MTVLGSTGSIGTQALDVLRAYPERFDLVGLSASSNTELLAEQVREFSPRYVALEGGNTKALGDFDDIGDVELISGPGATRELAALASDVVLNGVVGFAGLAATVSALEAGNRLALANKESIVAGGEWVMELARENPIIPVDSEHSAIFQCLEGRPPGEVSGVILTASGGPFFERPKKELLSVGTKDALKHPTWSMGVKNTLDSATMMNKGLEVIEAHHLFALPIDDVKVVVHRQSVVHGGVTLEDGAVILHASPPDMRLAISHGLLHPERVDLSSKPTDFSGVSWTFDEPRDDVFRCLPLAREAGRLGGAYPVALNAANEIAIEAFAKDEISFLSIAEVIESTLEALPDLGEMRGLEAIAAADQWARDLTLRNLQNSSFSNYPERLK